jgi:transcriptional regulator with XRE-family HTH domain
LTDHRAHVVHIRVIASQVGRKSQQRTARHHARMAGSGDLIRMGRQLRALRRRKRLRQRDVAALAACAQSTVSLVERGHGDRVTLRLLEAIAATLDARLDLTLRWRAGDLDRLTDGEHADIGGEVAAFLRTHHWELHAEVTYSVGREQGSIDLLAWHAETRTLLVIEIKTELVSAERLLRSLDIKVRLAPGLARRFGWHPASVSRLIIVAESTTNRRRAAAILPLLGSDARTDARALRGWVRRPTDRLDGLWLWSPTRASDRPRRRPVHRIRVGRAA